MNDEANKVIIRVQTTLSACIQGTELTTVELHYLRNELDSIYIESEDHVEIGIVRCLRWLLTNAIGSRNAQGRA
jgi:hypothetical protein